MGIRREEILVLAESLGLGHLAKMVLGSALMGFLLVAAVALVNSCITSMVSLVRIVKVR